MTAEAVRARFEDITRQHFAAPLPGGVVARPADPATWGATMESLRAITLRRGEGLDLSRLFTAEEQEKFAALRLTESSGFLEHRLVFMDGDDIVGCYWGTQEAYGRYYMIATMLRPDFQGRGIYTAFLPRILAVAREMGFRDVTSRHHPDNNAILVPKLKAGFTISSFEITHNFGLLVHLRYPMSEALRDVIAFRIEATAAMPRLEAMGILKKS